MIQRIILILFIALFFSSCGNRQRNFFDGQVKKIQFSREYFLEGKKMDTDTIGNFYPKLFGSYVILRTHSLPYSARIYTVDDFTLVGTFFNRGQGPQDFLGFSIVRREYPRLWVMDAQNRRLSVLNTEKGFGDDSFQIERTYSLRGISHPFNVFYVNDTLLWVKSFDMGNSRLSYYKFNPQTEEKIGAGRIMYNFPVTVSLIHKMLSGADAIHPDGTKIVSVTRAFNQIDILNLKDVTRNLSVTTGDRLTSFRHVNNTHRDDLREYYLGIPVVNEHEIFVMHHSEQPNQTEVRIITWEGEPIAILHLNRRLRGFDVDASLNFLYGIEPESEALYRFDLRNLNLRPTLKNISDKS